MVEGDGTMTNLALALPCARIWKDPVYNPGGARVVLWEYPHHNLDSLETLTGLWATRNQRDDVASTGGGAPEASRAGSTAEGAAASANDGDAAAASSVGAAVSAEASEAAHRRRVSPCGGVPSSGAAECFAVDVNGDGEVRGIEKKEMRQIAQSNKNLGYHPENEKARR